MLTEEEKNRIRLEEIYRREVAKELDRPQTFLEKVLNFFNTTFGFWILTSVLVGIASFSFNYFYDKNERDREQRQLIRKIDYEMQSRLYQYDALLSTLISFKSDSNDSSILALGSSRYMQQFSQTGLYDTWLNFKNAVQFELLSIQYPEFQHRSMPSLITELIDQTEEEDKKKELADVRTFIMSDGMFANVDLRGINLTVDQIKTLQNILRTRLMLDRWKLV